MTGDPSTRWTGPDGEPTLADVQREFPGYECWRGVSGLYHARLHGQPKADITGEDPRDLRDQINRHVSLREDEHPHQPADPGHPPDAARTLSP